MMLVDAGPLVALIDGTDADHAKCFRTAQSLSTPLITSWPVFTEAMYLLGSRSGWWGHEKLWRLVLRGDVKLAPIETPMLERASMLMEKYQDLPMDLADASLVVLAESLEVHCIFTLDEDFRVYRLHGRKAFEIIP